MDNSYAAIMARKNEIIRNSVGMEYSSFEYDGIGFDYEAMMASTGYTLPELQRVQAMFSVGNTPLIELRNLTALARKCAPKGKGARIFIKDESTNPSGSFKARRSCTSVYQAKKLAAVACHAAMAGLKCIVVQECYDSRGVGQPEIIEKARKCEALGAEVVQLTVGPELFSTVLRLLEETGYFNASLYTPFGIAGVETLGYEIAQQFRAKFNRDPDAVVCTNAGGGNLTGTARGLRKANCNAKVIGASVNLSGLHMASDEQFNKKSFTTGHTGFGIPFCVNPDRSDVPRSAARPLRYMDRYVTVTQGSVFFITEALASLEGLEKGPAGNTALAAAFRIAQEMDEDQMIVVQETEYTGAGKHINPQLSFARSNGIDIHFGDPKDEIPGKSIILPAHPSLINVTDCDLDHVRRSNIKNAVGTHKDELTDQDIQYLIAETNSNEEFVRNVIASL